jgi:SAM-dependent methyltransferase
MLNGIESVLATEINSNVNMDSAPLRYLRKRIAHWNGVSTRKKNPNRPGNFYHSLLRYYYRFFIPEGLCILELGCGHGDLLADLHPSLGVGVDFAEEMVSCASEKHPELSFLVADAHDFQFNHQFDVVILSDLANDLWDLQAVLLNVSQHCHSGTRLILNFYNNLWRLPLAAVRRLGLGAELLEQNWFSPNDVVNLLQLAGFEVIKHQAFILLPINIPLVSAFANRVFVHLIPFRWFAMTNFVIARPRPATICNTTKQLPSVSVIVPARNEAGNIDNIIRRIPEMGKGTEIVFVEGNSTDNTYEAIEQSLAMFPEKDCKVMRQTGRGKGDAVRLGFEKSSGDVLMILDADMTVPPEDLRRFLDAIIEGNGEFVNGVRLVYPLEDQSMRFFNILGNKFFSLAFSWLLGQPIKDTLCGTKVLWRRDYTKIVDNRAYFGNFDPFGDFDLIFGAAKLNLKIVEMPVRYRARIYGDTNISRWRHGWLLLKMVGFAAKRIKFI